MGYEIDFLQVGVDSSKSGDAIALRWGDLHGPRGEQTVAVIDGGFMDSGEALVELIEKYYNTDRVDYVLSTHPDADHASGLLVLLDKMQVGTLLMHLPWSHEHTNSISDVFKSGRVTDNSVRERLKKSLDTASDLEALARSKSIPIVEPFAGLGTKDGVFRILGPTKAFYESLLPEFRELPQTVEGTASSILSKAASTITNWLDETLDIETLTDKDDTSPENNSSAIAMLTVDGRSALFSADSGKPALTAVLDRLDSEGFDYSSLKFVQVPHHGSRRNVGPTILNRLLGPKQLAEERTRTAFVSAAKEGAPSHPSKKVANAFRRRGAPIYTTASDGAKWHSHDAPDREGYSTATPLPFYDQVEE